jgi:hypothetical protein
MTLEVASRPARLVWNGVSFPLEIAVKEGVGMYISFKYRTFFKRVWLFKSHLVVGATGSIVKRIKNKQLDEMLWRADVMENHTIALHASVRIGDILDTKQGL